jgi:hypothetical protein
MHVVNPDKPHSVEPMWNPSKLGSAGFQHRAGSPDAEN